MTLNYWMVDIGFCANLCSESFQSDYLGIAKIQHPKKYPHICKRKMPALVKGRRKKNKNCRFSGVLTC